MKEMKIRRLWTWLCSPRYSAESEISIFDGNSSRINVGDATPVQLPRPDFLDNGFLRSADGLIAFKKRCDSPLLPEYLECQLEGLGYFDRVIRGEERPASYEAMMIQHHQILSTGLAGDRNYKVGFSGESSKEVAGKLRHADGRVAFPARESEPVNAILLALAAIEFYPRKRWRIRIDGIPREAGSVGIRVRTGFNIEHPYGKHIPLFFFRMSECLAMARHLSTEFHAGRRYSRSRLLPVLATYFHLGIHAHAFVRINQSLLWAQVNYLLMLNDCRPVYHGHLDLVAAFLDTGGFRNYFIRYLNEQGSIDSTSET